MMILKMLVMIIVMFNDDDDGTCDANADDVEGDLDNQLLFKPR